jgi:folate-binding protein YgfZ
MTDLAFRNVQKQGGAVFPDVKTDAPAALHFGDPAAEYQAAKDECALFDLSDRTQIEITGKDRVTFLHNFCTNDIKNLKPGEGCEAFITNLKGRVLGHFFVFVEENAIWLETVPHAAEPLLEHLGKYILAEDVKLHDRSAEYGELFISGPKTFENVIQPACWVTDRFEQLYGHLHLIPEEDLCRCIRRADLLGAEGFLISVKREAIDQFWSALLSGKLASVKSSVESTAEEHDAESKTVLRPAGFLAFHALRIEAGMPLYGIDISGDNLAQEVGRTKQAISFTKGCYLGQEPIARIDALGHVNRELCVLKLSTGSAPPVGSVVKTEDGSAEIGNITSSVLLPLDNTPLAMGYLQTLHNAPGTSVVVQIDDISILATVFRPEG